MESNLLHRSVPGKGLSTPSISNKKLDKDEIRGLLKSKGFIKIRNNLISNKSNLKPMECETEQDLNE